MDPQVTLDICYDVRRRLHENGVEMLSLDFPILEMKAKGVVEDSHYLGYCHSTHEDWEEIDETHKIAKVHKVDSVEICLQDPTTQEIYSLERILPTLLHEFAHAITPAVLVYGHDENGKSKRKWGYNSHDDEFYTSFSLILDVAEKLGIYKLPTGFSKNNKISLRRFDRVDVDGKNVFVGQTSLFSNATAPTNTAPVPQKLVVANEKGETKLLVLKSGEEVDLYEELRDNCIKKFQVKKKKGVLKFTTHKGDPIEDSEQVKKALQEQEPIKFRVT